MLVRRLRRSHSIEPTIGECLVYSPIVGSMLVHRLRRRPDIEPTMGECLVVAGEANTKL